jgi:glycogen phosphorylase
VLRNVMRLPEDEIWNAHLTAKQALFAEIERRLHNDFDLHRLTLGFARRVTGYKRANLLLQDLSRLKSIGARRGLQVVYAGKAHPRDEIGKQIIHEIFRQQAALLPEVHVIFLENYDWELARLLVAGVDVWLNTPQPPLEASGTSGMKAALNGVPSLSILDGWWLEGCIENVTGWAIGDDSTQVPAADRSASDANALYEKLERVVVPLFYGNRREFLRIMRHAIALNGAHFNSQRMVQEYVAKAYFD